MLRACQYLEDYSTCNQEKTLAAWPGADANTNLFELFGKEVSPGALTAKATSKETAQALYEAAIELYGEDGATAGHEDLEKCYASGKLTVGAGIDQAAVTTYYEKWMRVLSFPNQDFWCQADRYSPANFSGNDLRAHADAGIERRMLADLAAKKLESNELKFKDQSAFVYLEDPLDALRPEESAAGTRAYTRYKLLGFAKAKPAIYHADTKTVLIPCRLVKHDNADINFLRHPYDKCDPGYTAVPLASLLHNKWARWKLSQLLFDQKIRCTLASSLLGSFHPAKRDLISQIAPSKPPHHFQEEL